MRTKKICDMDRRERRTRVAELAARFGGDRLNLDCEIDSDDLWDLWNVIHVMPRITARALFPEKPSGYVTLTGWIGAYAANKATAMDCRKRGDVNAATCYEKICEGIYGRFPETVRW